MTGGGGDPNGGDVKGGGYEDSKLREAFEKALAAEAEGLDWEIPPEAVKALAEKYKGEEFPLFMSEIPPDVTGNPHLEALQELMYGEDTTPEGRAMSFKDAGNQCFEEAPSNKQRYDDALKFYTQGIEQDSKDNKLNSLLYSNRSMVHLVRGRFVECVDDSRRAVEWDPSNEKAYYRGAKASYYMQLFRQAATFCRIGLAALPAAVSNGGGNEAAAPARERGKSSALQALLVQCELTLEKQEKKRVLAEEEEKKESVQTNLKEAEVNATLNRRGIVLVPGEYDGVVTGAQRPWIVHATCGLPSATGAEGLPEDAAVGVVHWPALLLYDEVMVSEVILDFAEDSSLLDQLKVILPGDRFPEWDAEKKYSYDTVNAYLDVGVSGEVYEVPVGDNLGQLLDTAKRVAGFPVFHILASRSEAEKKFRTDHTCKHLSSGGLSQ